MDRSQYEQQWTFDPDQELPSDAPKPWLVCGYCFTAVNNVLRVDYLARRLKANRTEYELPRGRITYIGHRQELHGHPRGTGTLFVLWGESRELERIVEDAHAMGIPMRDLLSGPKAR